MITRLILKVGEEESSFRNYGVIKNYIELNKNRGQFKVSISEEVPLYEGPHRFVLIMDMSSFFWTGFRVSAPAFSLFYFSLPLV